MKAKFAIFVVAIALQSMVIAAEDVTEEKGKYRFEIDIGFLDQSGSEQSSIKASINYKELNTILYESNSEEWNIESVPTLSYSVTELKLLNEERHTNLLSVDFFSLKWSRRDINVLPYLKVGFGNEKIEVKNGANVTTKTDDNVFIWSAGFDYPISQYISITYDYKLTQKYIFSNKTQHESNLNLKFTFE